MRTDVEVLNELDELANQLKSFRGEVARLAAASEGHAGDARQAAAMATSGAESAIRSAAEAERSAAGVNAIARAVGEAQKATGDVVARIDAEREDRRRFETAWRDVQGALERLGGQAAAENVRGLLDEMTSVESRILAAREEVTASLVVPLQQRVADMEGTTSELTGLVNQTRKALENDTADIMERLGTFDRQADLSRLQVRRLRGFLVVVAALLAAAIAALGFATLR